jgi:hypothetical protein
MAEPTTGPNGPGRRRTLSTGRGRRIVIGVVVAVLGIGAGVVAAFGTRDDQARPAPTGGAGSSAPGGVPTVGPSVPVPSSPGPSGVIGDPAATTAPTVAPTVAPVTGSGAAALIARKRPAGVWPGRLGLSGVNGDPLNNRAAVEGFCTARGKACQVAHTYTDRTSWESMTRGTGWTFEMFAGFPGALVVSQGLVPEGHHGDLAGCARGEFDQNWRDFGALMVQHGRGDSVVRLGWEFNGTFMAWHATDAKTWIACYRKAAIGIRAGNPQALFDWTINAHNTPKGVCGGRSTNCYPGDAYVDVIGIDNYDHHPVSKTKAAFDRTAAAPEGLTWLYSFARKHRKPFAVGEWGVVPTVNGGKDNPNFIKWMHAWFAKRAPFLAYEAYFSNCEAGGVQSSLFRSGDPACHQNPGSASAYRTLFGR